jgi:pyruvate, water dikinase
MGREGWVRWFDDIRLKHVLAVDGKTASLGELSPSLKSWVPGGFALIAETYRAPLGTAGIESELRRLLADFDHRDVAVLATRAATASQQSRIFND